MYAKFISYDLCLSAPIFIQSYCAKMDRFGGGTPHAEASLEVTFSSIIWCLLKCDAVLRSRSLFFVGAGSRSRLF